MKKLFLVALTLVFALTLAACDGDKNKIEDTITDIILDDFDDDLSHVQLAMNNMDFSNAMTMTLGMNMNQSYNGTTLSASMLYTDKYVVQNEMMAMSREIDVSIDEVDISLEVIMIEVSDGYDIYVKIGDLVAEYDDMGAEMGTMLSAFNLDADWLMVHFADSFEDMAEVEVLKDLVLEIILMEFGALDYQTIEDEIELDSGVDFDSYGVDIVGIGTMLEAGNYTGIQTMLENADLDGLLLALNPDAMDQSDGFDSTALSNALMNLDIEAFYNELGTFDFEALVAAAALGETGFEAYLNTLTSSYPVMKSIFEAFIPTVGILDDEGYLDELAYISQNMDQLFDFTSFDYYVTEGLFNVTADLGEDNAVVTTLTISPSALGDIFQDASDTLYDFMDGIPGVDMPYVEHLNCPPSADYCENFDPYVEVKTELANAANIGLDIIYTPGANQKMEFALDLSDFMESMNTEMNDSMSMEMTMNMTMIESATVTAPTGAANVEDALIEVAQLALLENITNDVRNAYYDMMYMNNTVLNQEYTLNELGYNRLSSLALDLDMSTVVFVGVDSLDEVEVELYWIDGTNVFEQVTITLSELEISEEENINDPMMTRENLLSYISLLDQDNISIAKAFLYIALNDMNDDDYYYEEEYYYEEGY